MIDCIVWDRCNSCTNIKFAYRSVSQNISKCHILIWDQIQGHVDRLLSIQKIYISVWVGQVAIAYISPLPNHDNVYKCGERTQKISCPHFLLEMWRKEFGVPLSTSMPWKSINFCERPKGNFNGPFYATQLYPFSPSSQKQKLWNEQMNSEKAQT